MLYTYYIRYRYTLYSNSIQYILYMVYFTLSQYQYKNKK